MIPNLEKTTWVDVITLFIATVTAITFAVLVFKYETYNRLLLTIEVLLIPFIYHNKRIRTPTTFQTLLLKQ